MDDNSIGRINRGNKSKKNVKQTENESEQFN